jgi:alpha-glucosidase (family GH31 glycosyl hydrolase)
MLGPAVMQAPSISEGVCARRVVLPAGSWYAVDQAAWVEGGVILERTKTDAATPLFLRGGAILPWSTLEPGSNRWDGSAVDFLVFLHQGAGSAVYRLVCEVRPTASVPRPLAS